MGHWTNQGFETQPLSYYKAAIQDVFRAAFGSDFALDDTLPQGVLIQRLAELFYGMDMDGVEAYSRLNLNSMGGTFLDVVGNLRGLPRLIGVPQSGTIEITCAAENFIPFTIPADTEFTVSGSTDIFKSTAITTVTTPNATTITVDFYMAGNSSALIGDTLTVDGYPQITNIEITSLFDGIDRESDLAYRTRLQQEYPAAVGTIEYILSELRKVPGMRSVGVLYNDTGSTSTDGIPAYATEFLVVGEPGVTLNTQLIAEKIARYKAPGVPTWGTTSETVTVYYDNPTVIKFTEATEKNMMISVAVSAPESTGVLDMSNWQKIREDIVYYITHLNIGEDVSFARCMGPLTADPGFDITSFKMKASGDADWVTNANYIIGTRECANITVDNIALEV